MDHLDGLAHQLEPRVYDEESMAQIEDGSISDFKGEIDLMQIAEVYIDGMNIEEDLKQKLVKSVILLYKETLAPSHEN